MQSIRHIATMLLLGLWIFPFPSFGQDPLKLRQLEREVETLKEETLKAKAQLRLLQEEVLYGKITGTKAVISLINGAEGYFKFQNCEIYLGPELISKVTRQELTEAMNREHIVFDSEIPPGHHVLTTKMIYSGSKKGVITYFETYRFNVEARHEFEAEYGKVQRIQIVTADRGYFETELRDRLAINYRINPVLAAPSQ